MIENSTVVSKTIDRPKMVTAFYRSEKGAWDDKLVSLVDRSPYSHSEMCIYDEEVGMYDCVSSNYNKGGVTRRYRTLTSGNWHVVPTNTPPTFLFEWYAKNKHRKYDYFGLFNTLLKFIWNSQKRVFCSEACAQILGYRKPGIYGIRRLFKKVSKNGKVIELIKT